MDLRIAHLYPDLMSIYGDRGNVLTLAQRARWRDIAVEVRAFTVGQDFDADWPDVWFFGGGQDQGQDIVGADLAGPNGEALRTSLANGAMARPRPWIFTVRDMACRRPSASTTVTGCGVQGTMTEAR